MFSKGRLVIFITLILPVLLIAILNQCSNTHQYHQLPKYHSLSNFSGLITADNKSFGTDSLKGYFHVADFFFTNCPGVCKTLSKSMAKIQEKVAHTDDVKLVSYSIDPQNDTPARLAAYAQEQKAIPGRWYFLTGNQDSIFSIAKNSYKVPLQYEAGTGENGFTHTESFVLVDKDLRVRGFYNALDDRQLDTLAAHIKLLRIEYLQQK
jgi:protein SCO1/2